MAHVTCVYRTVTQYVGSNKNKVQRPRHRNVGTCHSTTKEVYGTEE